MDAVADTTIDPAIVADDVMRRLRAQADAERRAFVAGYFPTALEILGVSAPALRRVARDTARAFKASSPAQILAVADALLQHGTHEGRQAAYELLAARRDCAPLLTPAVVNRLGRGNDNWASVDSFGVSIAGPAWRDGRMPDAVVARWARSPNPWWRRTALVATVALNTRSRGGTGDPARTLHICGMLARDPHPLVIKALSWALRALIPHDRAAVELFLQQHELPALVRREVGNVLRTGRKSG